MKMLARALLLAMAGLLWNGLVHAEGGCPPGMYPFRFAPNQPSSCAPIPGNGNQQTPQQQITQWERRWGAVATDGPRGAMGVATDRGSEREASQAAMQDCQSKGGVNCQIDTAYDNQCAAVVVGDGGYNVSSRRTADQAAAVGMKTCRDAGRANCHVHYSACSLPVRVQ
jgi:hypothetical protein